MKERLHNNEWVLPAGNFPQDLTFIHEVLHNGMNGRRVERITAEGPDCSSYILKYLPPEAVETGESWAYRYVLHHLPAIYPELIAASADEETSTPWLLFEDLGTIDHTADESTLIQVAEWAAIWHSTPLYQYPELPRSGQKPGIDVIISDLMAQRNLIAHLLLSLEISDKTIDDFYHLLAGHSFSEWEVYSHGDLHAGNYGRTSSGRVVVLDWEHNHRNTPLWDLYHMLDMSHPLFPKNSNRVDRNKVLEVYLDAASSKGNPYDYPAFMKEYMLFSSAFSMWMLLLIHRDLENPNCVWPHERLIVQREETQRSLLETLGFLEIG
ncbi:phosphotransferase [Neobacillus mesonae]|nr:phosphotransferase [Neobacillus mesonae]